MKRRTKGTGTIVKMGEWYYGRIVRSGKVKVIKLTKNARESESQWREWLEKNPAASAHPSAKVLISEAWPRLEAKYLARAIAPAVLTYYRRHYETFSAYMISHGKEYLEEVTPLDIRNYLDVETAGKSNVLRRNHLMMIRGLFEVNLPEVTPPTREVKLQHENQTCREPLTQEEINAVLESALRHEYGRQFHALIKIALYTSYRLKDCVMLKKEMVVPRYDSDGKPYWAILHTPYKTAKKGIEAETVVHPSLKEELDSLGVEEGYYLPDLVELHKRGLINGRLKRIFQAAINGTSVEIEGRTRKVPLKTFHALRATCITRMAEKNVPIQVVSSICGHTNRRQTMHYFHPAIEVKMSAVETLNFESDEEETKVFLHPEVKKLMDAFEKQKEEFLKKMEETIGRLTNTNAITSSGNATDTRIHEVYGSGGKEVRVRLSDAIRRKLIEKMGLAPNSLTLRREDAEKFL